MVICVRLASKEGRTFRKSVKRERKIPGSRRGSFIFYLSPHLKRKSWGGGGEPGGVVYR